jgi:hypothetical protein
MEKDVAQFRAIAEPGILVALKDGKKDATPQIAPDGKRITFSLANPPQTVSGTITPAGQKPSTRVAVLIGKAGATKAIAESKVQPVVAALREAGIDVLALDLILQEGDTADSPNRAVKNPREFAGYTYGYNQPLIVQRAQDVMIALHNLRRFAPATEKVALIALDPETAPVAALAAAATDQKSLNALVVETGGFRFQNVTDIRDPRFLPVIAKYGDLPGFLALNAPRKIFVMGEGPGLPGIANAAYEVAEYLTPVRTIEKA